MCIETEADGNIFSSHSQVNSSQAAELIELLYADLKDLAFSHLARDRAGHTLTPTAVVNETYLRLYQMRELKWLSKGQFLALCSEQMRRILVDYARNRQAEKRGGKLVKVTLYEENLPNTEAGIEVELIHQVLGKLGGHYPELEKLVELRFFAGLTNKEISEYFDIAPATVKRKWTLAKAMLRKELSN